jgi:hypothetical protein
LDAGSEARAPQFSLQSQAAAQCEPTTPVTLVLFCTSRASPRPPSPVLMPNPQIWTKSDLGGQVGCAPASIRISQRRRSWPAGQRRRQPPSRPAATPLPTPPRVQANFPYGAPRRPPLAVGRRYLYSKRRRRRRTRPLRAPRPSSQPQAVAAGAEWHKSVCCWPFLAGGPAPLIVPAMREDPRRAGGRLQRRVASLRRTPQRAFALADRPQGRQPTPACARGPACPPANMLPMMLFVAAGLPAAPVCCPAP